MALAMMVFGAAITSRAQTVERPYDPLNSYSAFAEYSNDSSHMLIGQSQNRRLLGVGGSYNRRLLRGPTASWRYEVDVRPLLLLQQPVQTFDSTVTPVGGPSSTYHMVTQEQKLCTSSSGGGQYFDTSSSKTPVLAGTFSYTLNCTRDWFYGGGISPLGQRVNFFPEKRLQPFVVGNAGFLAFSKVVPSNNATMFNFSFEFAAGAEWYEKPGRSVALDIRYHHISNAGRGMENPGVDSAVVKVAYTFSR